MKYYLDLYDGMGMMWRSFIDDITKSESYSIITIVIGY